jgi:hypothetical protein
MTSPTRKGEDGSASRKPGGRSSMRDVPAGGVGSWRAGSVFK